MKLLQELLSLSESTLVEGMYVIKNKDGVEKRFKNPNSPEAIAWKDTSKPKAVKAAKVDKKAQLEHEVRTVEHCLTTSDGWGEMDYFDVMTRKVFPAIAKAVRNDESKFSEDFQDALYKATSRSYGTWDKMRPWLDKAAKEQGYKDFDAFADSMNSANNS